MCCGYTEEVSECDTEKNGHSEDSTMLDYLTRNWEELSSLRVADSLRRSLSIALQESLYSDLGILES